MCQRNQQLGYNCYQLIMLTFLWHIGPTLLSERQQRAGGAASSHCIAVIKRTCPPLFPDLLTANVCSSTGTINNRLSNKSGFIRFDNKNVSFLRCFEFRVCSVTSPLSERMDNWIFAKPWRYFSSKDAKYSLFVCCRFMDEDPKLAKAT